MEVQLMDPKSKKEAASTLLVFGLARRKVIIQKGTYDSLWVRVMPDFSREEDEEALLHALEFAEAVTYTAPKADGNKPKWATVFFAYPMDGPQHSRAVRKVLDRVHTFREGQTGEIHTTSFNKP